MKDKNFR